MQSSPVRAASALGRTAWNAYAYNISYRTGKAASASAAPARTSCEPLHQARNCVSPWRVLIGPHNPAPVQCNLRLLMYYSQRGAASTHIPAPAVGDTKRSKCILLTHRAAHRRQECGGQLQRAHGGGGGGPPRWRLLHAAAIPGGAGRAAGCETKPSMVARHNTMNTVYPNGRAQLASRLDSRYVAAAHDEAPRRHTHTPSDIVGQFVNYQSLLAQAW